MTTDRAPAAGIGRGHVNGTTTIEREKWMTSGQPCYIVRYETNKALDRLEDEGQFDLGSLLRYGHEEHPGVDRALTELRNALFKQRGPYGQTKANREWERELARDAAYVKDFPSQPDEIGCRCDPTADGWAQADAVDESKAVQKEAEKLHRTAKARRQQRRLEQADFAAAMEGDGAGLSRLTTLTPQQVRDLRAELDLVEGVIGGPGTLNALDGARGGMKSLTALGLAGAVGCGHREVYGLRVARQAEVLYVYLEGVVGLGRRLRAWEAHHKTQMAGVHFTTEPVDLKDPDSVRDLALKVRELKAQLVIIDTVAKSGGGKEDAEDFGAYRIGLETLRDATGVTVLIVHNAGLKEADRARGHSTLVDGLDSAVVLKREADGRATMKEEKSRDSAAMPDIPLSFRPAGPLMADGASWSGVVVRMTEREMDTEKAVRDEAEREEVETLARQVIDIIDAYHGAVSPADMARSLMVDPKNLAKKLKPLTDRSIIADNGKKTTLRRYIRGVAGTLLNYPMAPHLKPQEAPETPSNEGDGSLPSGSAEHASD